MACLILLVGVPGKDIGADDSLVEVGLAYVSSDTGQLIRTLNHPAPTVVGAEFAALRSQMQATSIRTGVSDMLIGAPGEGHAYVFSGKTGGLLFNIVGPFVEFLSIPSARQWQAGWISIATAYPTW